ncbi:hypothetical protein [Streptomyces noursei]|uniref:hypothetical protein n=1 Tax=Streptomyces noursei TaxID=1971 RepID=UPI0023B7C692|nr:hypothetical protein [Streptomyces noursei]
MTRALVVFAERPPCGVHPRRHHAPVLLMFIEWRTTDHDENEKLTSLAAAFGRTRALLATFSPKAPRNVNIAFQGTQPRRLPGLIQYHHVNLVANLGRLDIAPPGWMLGLVDKTFNSTNIHDHPNHGNYCHHSIKLTIISQHHFTPPLRTESKFSRSLAR